MDCSKEKIASLIGTAVELAASDAGVKLPDDFSVLVDRPKVAQRGDWTTNAAMKFAKLFGVPPLELASKISARVRTGDIIEKIEIAAPGFINISLTKNWIAETIESVMTLGVKYGSNNTGKGKRAQVEFVSANPTGPLHLGHGRGGAVGDVMSSILAFSGWEVEREYYINDA
ncbi:MAG: arginine--tRNA ligase, partial [Synergistaceae bacterium]|nr:arginine--tRNA ligase [Synergistaceae bacterium]